jgi:hypothetical protein
LRIGEREVIAILNDQLGVSRNLFSQLSHDSVEVILIPNKVEKEKEGTVPDLSGLVVNQPVAGWLTVEAVMAAV